MAATLHIPISDYLTSSYRPDREFVDGELRERNVGKWEHARVQWLLAAWFFAHERAWQIVGSTKQRVRVAPNRVRVPDLVVVFTGPQPDVLVDSPLLVIEILSPDDTYSDTEERAQDYLRMGVPCIWIVDPKTRTGRMCVGSEWTAADQLQVPGTPLHVDLPLIFSQIDSSASQA